MMASMFNALVLLLLTVATDAFSVTKQVQLGDHDYFLPPAAAWSLTSWSRNATSSKDEYLPASVVHVNTSQVTAESLRTALEVYNTTDDVWTESFTKAIYIYYTGNDTKRDFQLTANSLAPDYATETILYSWDHPSQTPPPEGPYFINTYTGQVFQAYRLFPDTNQAFLQTSFQDPDGFHTNLKAATQSAAGLSVAVPSRLYFTPTKEQPLAGIRLAVKDLYDLKGMKTSFGNRALFEINDVASETAVAVQKLINAGAIVVGKNKLSEFAFAGQYFLDHIDYSLPFNPRGDGYNSPGDSSGGSGASVASYDWLDISMGSDTGGSIRGPASANGVFGNRPSQDAVSLDGAYPLSSSMDTSGTMCRDPEIWAAVNKVLYADTIKEYSQYPSIVYTNFDSETVETLVGTEGLKIVGDFMDGLNQILGANATPASIDSVWEATSPHNGKNVSLGLLTELTYRNLTAFEQWNLFGQSFLSNYSQLHNGNLPYVKNSTLQNWVLANSSMSENSYQADLEWKNVVEDFSANELFLADNNTCADSIMVYLNTQGSSKFFKPDFDPVGQIGQPSSYDQNPYVQFKLGQRDEIYAELVKLNATCNSTNSTSGSSDGSSNSDSGSDSSVPTSPNRFASIAGLPDYALTIGSAVVSEEASLSDITRKNQSLPIAVNIMTRKGCDFMVQNLISVLYNEGIIKTVKAGSELY